MEREKVCTSFEWIWQLRIDSIWYVTIHQCEMTSVVKGIRFICGGDFWPIKFLFRIFGGALQSDAQPLIRWQQMSWQWPLLFYTGEKELRNAFEKYDWEIQLKLLSRNTVEFDQMATNGNKWADNDQCFSHTSLPRDSSIAVKSFIRYWLPVMMMIMMLQK